MNKVYNMFILVSRWKKNRFPENLFCSNIEFFVKLF